ncbi:hypothetical protein IQ250_25910 [Pseudanabaenaceae cyanobacterium LEGE 13415]|nr:hypothetical protein [Pseudanabaenaceae cyanobacterium LEGE 13415]
MTIGCNQTIQSKVTPATASPVEASKASSSVAPSQIAASEPQPHVEPAKPAILEGRYWIGHTGQAIEVQGDRYRYESEGGAEDWRSITELQAVKEGVIYGREAYWCLSSLAPKGQIASCSEKGWVVATNPDRKKLFSCLTTNGKQILLYDGGRTIDYSFGKVDDTPELSLQIPRSSATTRQWTGIGRSIFYSINVPNADVIYTVFWNADRQDQTVAAGVNVTKNEKIIATVNCASDIVNQMENVDLKEESL